jgi:putative ABC transport system substrate-binding protein
MRVKLTGIVTALILALLAAGHAAAEQANILRVGAVSLRPFGKANISDAFLKRMVELGYVQGQNFDFKFVHAKSRNDYETAYRDLIASGVDVLAAGGPEIALKAAAAAARGVVPNVMIAADYDPLELGYVASLAEPGGNITGVFFRQVALTEKRLELMREMLPQATGLTILGSELRRPVGPGGKCGNRFGYPGVRHRISRPALRLRHGDG